ncbi:MAG TPA: peptidase M23 [Rhodobacteraceae bacterium]|jgi:murein DD-endopeptidase MepM/ murein hydrolase activator NlpD|nr:peptidase M23 [Paracoccaceae bacterium]
MIRALFAGVAIGTLGILTGCNNFDLDFRNNFGNAPDTSDAARKATSDRPKPDNRGVISYPNYQVAVARRGDTLADVANRVSLPAHKLARFNGIAQNATLRKGEIIALPRRVSEPSPATGAITTGPLTPEPVDISTLAGNAIDNAGPSTTVKPPTPSGTEPVRHKVERGETAYTISRLYNVSVRSLADWNGLGANLSVREGQYLLIPVATQTRVASAATTNVPGTSSATPTPPSSTKPLPDEKPTAKPATTKPASPNLGAQATTASNAKLLYPVQGNIIRAYSKKSDGIDIAAPAGTPVKAAANGVVAAITRDTEQVPILVIRHSGNLLTIYANVANISVKKGDKISRGQVIAKVRKANPSFVHFEVRKNFDSVDPMPFLQ